MQFKTACGSFFFWPATHLHDILSILTTHCLCIPDRDDIRAAVQRIIRLKIQSEAISVYRLTIERWNIIDWPATSTVRLKHCWLSRCLPQLWPAQPRSAPCDTARRDCAVWANTQAASQAGEPAGIRCVETAWCNQKNPHQQYRTVADNISVFWYERHWVQLRCFFNTDIPFGAVCRLPPALQWIWQVFAWTDIPPESSLWFACQQNDLKISNSTKICTSAPVPSLI